MNHNKFNREWVKTFAIIFLSVLLVLTFFSNTIMNMSLPEVSTQYIQYGSIKTQVRGSGTVIAQDNYSVTYPATREVLQVAVRQGQTVNKGDVLFYLAQGDSAELEAARESYENLNYEYTRMLITSASSKDQSDELLQLEEDLAEAKRKLDNAEQIEAAIALAKENARNAEKAVEQKQKEIAELEKEMSAIGYTPTEEEVLTGKQSNVTYEEYISVANKIYASNEKLDAAETELKLKKTEYEVLQREYDQIQSQIETPLETLEQEIKQSDRNLEAMERDMKYLKQEFYDITKNSSLERLYSEFENKQKKYKTAKYNYETALKSPVATDEEKQEAEDKYYEALYAMDNAYNMYLNEVTAEEVLTEPIERQLFEKETEYKYALEDNTNLKAKLTETQKLDEILQTKKTALKAAEKEYNTAQSVYDNAVAEKEITEKSIEKIRNGYKYAKVKEYEAKITEHEDTLVILKDNAEKAAEELAELEEENSESEETLRNNVKTLERQILQLTQDNKLASLELQKMKKNLDKAASEVKELEGKYTTGEVVSPVSGVIEAVNIVSGQKTQPDSPLVEIALAEQGFKLTMTATQEQAAKLRIGSQAEITSYVPYDSKISATLTAIKNDSANPGSRQKILEFTIDGDVTPGQTLSLAAGDKNASYENTVPNTAIREDGDGKYVLVVEAKSTPISTRYIARRASVTVVASDDTRSAITGDFDSYSYVIATSSKPINSGEQVKLVEK